jgi:hypothetical protein
MSESEPSDDEGQVFHLAQLNTARALAPLDSPQLAEFMDALDAVNALAEGSPGFVWRLTGANGNATDLALASEPGVLFNLSVWESLDSLFAFVYRSAHTEVLVRRREWFSKPASDHQVLWWIPAGHIPSLEEALCRLHHLQALGPSPEAFTFKQRYPPPAAGQPGPAAGWSPGSAEASWKYRPG